MGSLVLYNNMTINKAGFLLRSFEQYWMMGWMVEILSRKDSRVRDACSICKCIWRQVKMKFDVDACILVKD